MEKTNTSFEKGALILVTTGIIAKAMGALYRIPLTNIIGAEGIGLYQLILSTLLISLAISSNYLPAALSKCIAYLTIDKDNKETNRILNTALRLVLFITIVVSLILACLSKTIANFHENNGLYFCYLLLIPTIILSGIKNVYKGWMFGLKQMLYPSISQLIEEFVKIGVSLTLAYFGLKTSVIRAVEGAIIGLIAGEIVGLIYYMIIKSKITFKENKTSYNKILYYKLIISESTPILISSIVFPLVTFIDSFLIVKLLTNSGYSNLESIKQYGLLQGPTNSIIHLPIMIATSLSLAIIPVLSSLLSNYNIKSIKEKSSMSIKICLSLVVPSMIGLVIIINPVLNILYPKFNIKDINTCCSLFVYSSINIILLSLLEVFNSILQGLGEAKFATKVISISVILKILVEIVFINLIGIYGAILSNVIMYLIALIACATKYRILIGEDILLVQNISKIMCAGVIMALAVYFSIFAINSNALKIFVAIMVGIIVYLMLILLFKVYGKDELRMIPGIKSFIGVINDNSSWPWKSKKRNNIKGHRRNQE